MTSELVWGLRYRCGRGPDRSLQLSPGALLTIGRGSGAEIVVDDPEISRSHATLETRTEGVWVKDLGSGNGTYIDGARVTAGLWQPGQTLRLGAVEFELKKGDSAALGGDGAKPNEAAREPDRTPPARDVKADVPTLGRVRARPNGAAREPDATPPAPQAKVGRQVPGNSLRIVWSIKTEADKQHAITIPIGKSLVVGRDPKSDVVLDHATVSRTHARITAQPGGARVQDLDSENGTKIDGQGISETRWEIGQTLEIGDFVFSLENSDDSNYERALSVRNLRKRKRDQIVSALFERLRIFLSYSRQDLDVADKVAAALEKKGFEVIVDRRDLPYGEEWQRELADFIRNADTVLFLVSPNSVASQWCKWELSHVAELQKRLFPLAIGPVALEELPEELGKVHILPQEGLFDLDRHLPELVKALNTDRAWVKEHARLSDWAREWRARGKPAAMLLRGPALEAAEIWKSQQPKAEEAAVAVLELVKASRRGRFRRRCSWAAAGGVALLIPGLVAGWMYLGLLDAFTERDAFRELANSMAAEKRVESVRKVQLVLKRSRCYDGGISGRGNDAQEGLNKLVENAKKRGKLKPTQIDLANATDGDIEAWLKDADDIKGVICAASSEKPEQGTAGKLRRQPKEPWRPWGLQSSPASSPSYPEAGPGTVQVTK